MRRVAVAVPLALLVAASALAQTPAPPAQPNPAGQAPAQPAPKPTQPAPKPTTPAPVQQPPAAPLPFPQGAKVAYVNLQGIFQLSADGKAAAAKVESLTKQKQAQIAERQKTIQANQQKLQTGGTVMSAEARAQLEKDLEKQTRELERFQQDAQQELNDLQQELNDTFQRKLFPILTKMAEEKELHMLFSATDAGLIWAYGGLDLTEEAVKRLDAAK